MSLSDIVSNAGLATYAEVALVIFFAIFVGIVAYVFLRRRSTWERMRQLPLDDDSPAGTVKGRRP
jgi:cbb3-type cytochrome oxidase subunit 3